MFKVYIVLLLLFFTFLPYSFLYATSESDTESRVHHIGLKTSLISHTGLFYGYQLSENIMLSGGGYYYFENDDGSRNSILELGLELQRSLFKTSSFTFYTLAGIGYHNRVRSNKANRDWLQYGFGFGIMNRTDSGFTINVDAGVLRYRKTSTGSSDRVVMGLGFGLALGYQF